MVAYKCSPGILSSMKIAELDKDWSTVWQEKYRIC